MFLAFLTIQDDDALFNDLLSRARQLDGNVLAEIHDRYYPEVYRYVRFRLDDPLLCEDIAGEVFLRLIEAFSRQRGPDHNLRAWLLSTATHLINDHLRRRYRRRTQPLDEQEVEALVDDANPASIWEGAFESQQVRQAIARLTPDQQQVLALRFADERSLEETARLVGKNVNAVKALQFRALGALRRLLGGEA